MGFKVHREVGKYLRQLQKTNFGLLSLLEGTFEEIQDNPYLGELLETPFRVLSVRKWKTQYDGVGYRIIYIYQDAHIYLLHIGTRENLYRDLDVKTIKSFLKQ